MHDYHFTGAYPRVLVGLSQGVNALILPSNRVAPPYGSTIEAFPGDAVQTEAPYEHAELTEVIPEPQPLNADGSPILPPAEPVAPPVEPAPAPAPADPAAEAMTAEGAPAPTEPAAS